MLNFSKSFGPEGSPVEGQSLQQKDKQKRKRKGKKKKNKKTKSPISAHARAKLSQKHGARQSRPQSTRYLTVTCGTGKQTKIVKSRQRYSPVIVHFYKNCPLSRALIGSFLSSIRGQTDKILKRSLCKWATYMRQICLSKTLFILGIWQVSGLAVVLLLLLL